MRLMAFAGMFVLALAVGLGRRRRRRARPPCRRSRIRSRRGSSPRAAAIAPGETLWVALHLDMRPGWHVYWRNPGDSGLPTEIAWKLPPGFTAGEIAWPTPGALCRRRHRQLRLRGLGRSAGADHRRSEDRPARRPAARCRSQAHATWLACSDICIPGEARARARPAGRAPRLPPRPGAVASAVRRRARAPAATGRVRDAASPCPATDLTLRLPAAALAGVDQPDRLVLPDRAQPDRRRRRAANAERPPTGSTCC